MHILDGPSNAATRKEARVIGCAWGHILTKLYGSRISDYIKHKKDYLAGTLLEIKLFLVR